MKNALNPLSGFQQLMPEEQVLFDGMVDTIKSVYRLCGFVPFETPAMERKETILAAKGGIVNQVYTVSRLQGEVDFRRKLEQDGSNADIARYFDNTCTDMALRFDLTVPLARFVSTRHGELTFPFRRYQIQPVWRGERAQAGRYRQFLQCDIDIVGNEQLPILYDAEVPVVMANVLRKLGLDSFVIHLSNMKILKGILTSLGLDDDEEITQALRIIDNLGKAGFDSTVKSLSELGSINQVHAQELLEMIISSNDLEALVLKYGNSSPLLKEGVEELTDVYNTALAFGLSPDSIKIDLSIARGLNYYTGTVFETFVNGYRNLGSVSSGGRYDNLAENLGGKRFPGVGMTLGLSRLVAVLKASGKFDVKSTKRESVLVTVQDYKMIDDYLSITTSLRSNGIVSECMLYEKSLPKQLKYADRKNFRFVIIANEEELKNGSVNVKDLVENCQENVQIQLLNEYFQRKSNL